MKARVSKETKRRLAAIAEQRGGADKGVKISTIVREAVFEYLERREKKTNKPAPTHYDPEKQEDALPMAAEEPPEKENGDGDPPPPKIGFHSKKGGNPTAHGRKSHRVYRLDHRSNIPPRKTIKAGDLAAG